MKLNEFKQEEIPALVARNGARVKEVNAEERKNMGVPFSGAGMIAGDVVEMPDTEADIKTQAIEVRPNTDRWDLRLLVKKNGKLDWISMGFLVRQNRNEDGSTSPLHPVAEELCPLHDHDARIKAALGKTIIAGGNIEYVRQKFTPDGVLVDGEFERRMSPKLEFKA